MNLREKRYKKKKSRGGASILVVHGGRIVFAPGESTRTHKHAYTCTDGDRLRSALCTPTHARTHAYTYETTPTLPIKRRPVYRRRCRRRPCVYRGATARRRQRRRRRTRTWCVRCYRHRRCRGGRSRGRHGDISRRTRSPSGSPISTVTCSTCVRIRAPGALALNAAVEVTAR